MPIDFNQLKEFIEAIAKTDISELTIKEGDFELTVQKKPLETANITYSVTPPVTPQITKAEPAILPVASTTPSTPPVTEEKPPKAKKTDNCVEITSPMVGTFYRASAPGELPFVEVGDRISSGQVVCIIEAMKLMNEIEAEISGEVIEIAVENGEPVEYGQTLLWIAPS